MTTLEMVRYPGNLTDEAHDTLLKIAEGAFTKSGDKYRTLAAVVLRSYKYGVIMGKRMERARRKQ